MKNSLPLILIFTIWILSSVFSLIPFVVWGDETKAIKMVTLSISPILFIFFFPVIAGLISKIAHKGIVRGVFPREPFHPVYFLRRIYGSLWTQVFYFKPIYSVVLAIPLFKKLILKLFGYKFETDFTVYPDTWIRDLPLLKIEKGAYLSNRATIGTNICLPDGTILVDKVKVEEKGLIGHLAIVGPGCKLYKNSEIGVHAALGIRVSIKEGASVKPESGINHGSIIGEKTTIGSRTHIGLKCNIGPGLQIPAGANIPNGSILKNQDDIDKYYSSETEKLTLTRDDISDIIRKHLNYAS